jgi:hypothetical protein
MVAWPMNFWNADRETARKRERERVGEREEEGEACTGMRVYVGVVLNFLPIYMRQSG